MLFWVLLPAGLMLIASFAWLVLSMSRAERRARRSLYRGLGLAEATVDFLMQRNRDVLTELSYVRENATAAIETLQVTPPRPVGRGLRPNLRLVRPASGEARLSDDQGTSPNDRPTQH